MEACSLESPSAYLQVSVLLGLPPVGGVWRIYLPNTLIAQTSIQLDARSTTLRHPIAYYISQGILTLCPSTPAFAIALGPTNPSLLSIAKEPLVFRRPDFSSGLRLLVPTFSLRVAPRALTSPTSVRIRTLSYQSLASHFARC